jgi:hypothetical protein
MAGMLIFIYYRCQLNANLNVKIMDIPIKSWEDILESNYNLLIWLGTSNHDLFSSAAPDTTMSKLYHEKILKIPPEQHISGLGYYKSAEKITDGSSILMIKENPIYTILGFCGYAKIKTLEYFSKGMATLILIVLFIHFRTQIWLKIKFFSFYIQTAVSAI